MRRTVVALLGIFALVVCLSTSAMAQEFDKKWGLGLRASYYAPTDDTVEGVKYDPDSTFLIDANLTYFFIKEFSLEFLVGWTKPDVNAEISGLSVDFGELEQIPLLLTAKYHHWFNPQSSLYLGGGIGYYLNDFTLSDTIKAVDPTLNISADDSFGYHLNAGFETFIWEKTSLNVDFKYVINEADFNQTGGGGPPSTSSVDINAWVFGLGLKYYF